jgi:hypothetical protein
MGSQSVENMVSCPRMKTHIHTVPAIVIATVRLGLMARQRGMYITSPAKGGGTKNLFARLGAVTGKRYKNSDKGIAEAIADCETVLAAVREAQANGVNEPIISPFES